MATFLRRAGALAGLAVLILLAATGPAWAGPAPVRPASLGSTAPAVTAATAADADLCARVGYAAGFRGERLVLAVAIGLAESDCVPGARHANGASAGCPYGSTDRGLWQINDCYHAEVSDSCAYATQCNANAAYTISGGGADWRPWTTYTLGLYTSRTDAARAAVARLGTGTGGVVGTVSTGGLPLTVRSGPSSTYAAVGSVANGSQVSIRCQTRGQSVTGPWGATTLWDSIGSGRWVADAYVYTGSNGQVAPTC